MMDWTFELNGKPLSAFKHLTYSFPAYSGQGRHLNQRTSSCHKNVGPIPPGVYHIVDRPTGGRLGGLRDVLEPEKKIWFGLYADDGKLDDQVLCNSILRGNFRLHPEGTLGISEGCITIPRMSDFLMIRSLLLATKPSATGPSNLLTYGRVLVI